MEWAFLVVSVIMLIASAVWMAAAIYFYYFKFEKALKVVRHPWAGGRNRDELALHEQMKICTSLATWLAFPRANFWLANKSRELFPDQDAGQVPKDIKVTLFLVYGGLLVVCASLLFVLFYMRVQP